MKKYLLFLILITLSYNQASFAKKIYNGESAADSILKTDILHVISQSLSIWYGKNCRNIDKIHTQIENISYTSNQQIKEVIEYWQVTACKEDKIYRISLRPDAKGEVDFSVRLPPKNI